MYITDPAETRLLKNAPVNFSMLRFYDVFEVEFLIGYCFYYSDDEGKTKTMLVSLKSESVCLTRSIFRNSKYRGNILDAHNL